MPKNMLLNVRNHRVYSSLLSVNVLYLDQTELAAKEDYEYDLVHWAKVFKATTWEELNALVKGNAALEEVANIMYKSNIIPEEQTLIEGHKRFLAQKRGAYEAGILKGKEEEKERTEKIIAKKDKEIAALKEELEKLKKQS